MGFDGIRVVSLESRRAVEMEKLIRSQGGEPFVAPSMREVPLERNEEAFRFAERLFAGEFDMMVLLTGVGTRALDRLLATRYPAGRFAEAAAMLREEIIHSHTHRWPQVFIAFLLGSLLGWGVGLIFPTAHRAQSEIYVAYNGDAIYRNPDDYKNWQFSELEAYIVSNDVLGETLKRLGERDAYWREVSIEQLRDHLRIYWRNAGRWRLVAEWREQIHATDLAKTWTDALLEKTNQAAAHAGAVLLLDSQVKAYARDEVSLRMRSSQLSQLRGALQTWRDAQNARQSQPPERLDRWRLQYLAASLEGLVPVELGLQVQR